MKYSTKYCRKSCCHILDSTNDFVIKYKNANFLHNLYGPAFINYNYSHNTLVFRWAIKGLDLIKGPMSIVLKSSKNNSYRIKFVEYGVYGVYCFDHENSPKYVAKYYYDDLSIKNIYIYKGNKIIKNVYDEGLYYDNIIKIIETAKLSIPHKYLKLCSCIFPKETIVGEENV